MHRAVLASLALVALVHAAPITEATKTTGILVGDAAIRDIFPKPTFILLPPITGPIKPSDKRDTAVKERQTIIGGGGDATKTRITTLELEYETLLHTFGTNGPQLVKNRLKAIKDELLHKYGITIIQSPDGTTTTFTPGKRDFTFPGGPLPGGPMIPETPIPGGPMEPSD
ncbi:hypothetical protein F4801DRAFT_576112 [Xylaria longipes]|nr:hypothetical protein F4801DRAFT_576112 [Xylaria longipes]RYC58119.1 hypothetical protein CHU98_g8100 [Xylaria longipes]